MGALEFQQPLLSPSLPSYRQTAGRVLVRARSQGEPSPARVVLITEEDLDSLEPKCEYFIAKQQRKQGGMQNHLHSAELPRNGPQRSGRLRKQPHP